MYAYASKKGNVPLSFRQVERFRKKHFFPFLVTHIFHFWYDIERLCGDHFRPSGFRQSATPRKESGSPVEGPERFFRKRSARRKDGGKKANAHYAVNVRLPMDATNHATAPRWRQRKRSKGRRVEPPSQKSIHDRNPPREEFFFSPLPSLLNRERNMSHVTTARLSAHLPTHLLPTNIHASAALVVDRERGGGTWSATRTTRTLQAQFDLYWGRGFDPSTLRPFASRAALSL